MFKQESKYYEFFYKELVPGLHYVPVKRDLSNLVDKINWARDHDDDALKIAQSARQFSRDNLLPSDILCYYTVLFHVRSSILYVLFFLSDSFLRKRYTIFLFIFQEWSKRLKSKVEILDSMEEVPQPSHSCPCHFSDYRFEDEL